MRELMRLQLAEQNRTRVQQLSRGCCICSRHIVRAHRRAARREQARRVVNIFQTEGNAVQRAAILSAMDFRFRAARSGASSWLLTQAA